MDLGEILGSLAKLDQAELATVKAATEHLMVKQYDVVDTTSPLYETMTKLLGVGLSYREFHNVQAYATWRKTAPKVVSFIEQTWPRATRAAKVALMTFMIEALLDDLKGRGVPVTVGSVTANIARLPAVFEECFPDYKDSGLSHLVLKAMTRQPKEKKRC